MTSNTSNEAGRGLQWRARRGGGFVLLAMALAHSACSAAPTDGAGAATADPAASEQEALTGGVPALTKDLPSLGVVSLMIIAPTSIGYCSGTLLTNRWVLTARHCLCQAQVDSPSSVQVSVYGADADEANVQLGQLYTTTATKVIRNPTYDVALVQLSQTLPYTQPPLIYKGTGSDVVNDTTTAWGFGTNDAPNSIGDSLNWATMNIARVATSTGSVVNDSCSPAEKSLVTTGPFTLPLSGSTAATQEGDSGGPLFIEPSKTQLDLANHTLVGSNSGSSTIGTTKYDTYTGIWEVRDWIIASAPDIMPRSLCPSALPSSKGATSPSVSPGQDSAVHIVALQPATSTIGHWEIKNGSLSYLGVVPSVSTSTAAAIGLEGVVSGQIQMLGLAYRDKATSALKYTRWSGTSWSAPINVLGATTAGAPAMSSQLGYIAYVDANSVVNATAYSASSPGEFIASQRLPSGAPVVDPTKRLSIVAEPSNTTAYVGYRTAADEWVQAAGSWSSCYPTTRSFWCAPDPKRATDWTSASLSYASGQRLNLLVTRLENATDAAPSLENWVVDGPNDFPWGQNRMQLSGQPGYAVDGNNSWVAGESGGGLVVGKTDNCFANL